MAPNAMTETLPSKSPAKAAHVNMMTDTVIANMPFEGLRSIMRGLLGGDAQITKSFMALASSYLANNRPTTTSDLFVKSVEAPKPTAALSELQSRYRCLMGVGCGFESMEVLSNVITQVQTLSWDDSTAEGQDFMDILATIDGDVVQAVTAVQKELLTSSGLRPVSCADFQIVNELKSALDACQESATAQGQDFALQRGMSCLERILLSGASNIEREQQAVGFATNGFVSWDNGLESVKLGNAEVPRIFMGLWQFSSPAWGTASSSRINGHFRKHVDAGFTAYDMADHYGDAEVAFGQFRSAQPDSERIFCATKLCVFEPMEVSREAVDATIAERLIAINAPSVELLQFHWQDYNDYQYIEAARLIEESPQVKSFGLCNFDTQHMDAIVDSGVKVVSNQVQFSLIDPRPTFKMSESCINHNIKLLTYGSLCGGFLADKWLGMAAPSPYNEEMTPSHRKYFEMISIWGGWTLFQELLTVLAIVGKKYEVSVSSVAVRWVLDHEYVGAVIVGARMGISEHTQENLTVFSFRLDAADKKEIEKVLGRCNAEKIFQTMGDCGAEYR